MKRHTILLIEDDGFFSHIIKNALEKERMEVIWASNGEEGIRQARATMPDVIVLDVMMPKKNGFQVLDELKASDKTRHIPVMMLTSMSAREDIERCLSSGACEYMIKKHHNPEDVVRRVLGILAKPTGFSLVELILIIGAIFLLAGVAFFQYRTHQARQSLLDTSASTDAVRVMGR